MSSCKPITLRQPLSLRQIKEDSYKKFNPQLDRFLTATPKIPKKRSISTPSINAQNIKQTILSLVDKHFSSFFPSIIVIYQKWVQNQWKNIRTTIHSRLTKIFYLQPTLKLQSFTVIQNQIKLQWTKNPLLKALLKFLNHSFRKIQFQEFQEIQKFYHCFTLLIAQLSYQMYYHCFQKLIEQEFQVFKKLQYQTAVSIIVENKMWNTLSKEIIKPSFYKDCPSFSQNFNLQQLKVSSKILNIHSQTPLFQQTKKSIQKFIKSNTIVQFVASLNQYRCNLLKQIQYNISTQMKSTDKQVTVQKQDILGSIIYILVKYKMDEIGVTLKYLNFLFKDNLEEILRWHKVDYFKTDLQVAYQFLVQPVFKISFDLEFSQNENLCK